MDMTKKPEFRKHLFWAGLICLLISVILFLGIERTESPDPGKEVFGKFVLWTALIVGWGGLIWRRRVTYTNKGFPSLLDENVLPKKFQLISFLVSLPIGFGIALSFPEITSQSVLALVALWIGAGVFLLFFSVWYFWTAIKYV